MKTEHPLISMPWWILLSAYSTNMFAWREYKRIKGTFRAPGTIVIGKDLEQFRQMERSGLAAIEAELVPILAEIRRRMKLVGVNG